MKSKIISILILNLTIGYAAIFKVHFIGVKICLFFIAISISIYILSLPVLKNNRKI